MSESVKLMEFRCINVKGVFLYIKASSIYTAMDLAIERLDKLGHLIFPIRILDEGGSAYTITRSIIGSKGIVSMFCLTKDDGYFTVQLGSHAPDEDQMTVAVAVTRYTCVDMNGTETCITGDTIWEAVENVKLMLKEIGTKSLPLVILDDYDDDISGVTIYRLGKYGLLVNELGEG